MKIIITMAGRSSRFFNAGYKIPKFRIEIFNRSMFEWALLSLRDFFKNDFIFICLKEHNAASFIQEKSNILQIKKVQVIELDEVTNGQATTVVSADKFLDPDEEILIYNIDTHITPNILKRNQIKGDGWIPIFKALGDHWSFVRFDPQFIASEVAEKKRISDYGTIGLYYFKKYGLFKRSYLEFYHDPSIELYIAPLYNWFIQNQYEIYVSIVDIKDLYPLGTPEEVESTRKRLEKLQKN